MGRVWVLCMRTYLVGLIRVGFGRGGVRELGRPGTRGVLRAAYLVLRCLRVTDVLLLLPLRPSVLEPDLHLQNKHHVV